MLDIFHEFPSISSEASCVLASELNAAYDKLHKGNPLAFQSRRELEIQSQAQELADFDHRTREMHDQQAAQLEAQRNSERAAIVQSIEKAVNSRADKDLAAITALLKTPDVLMTRAALIEKHRQAWPTIESDLNHAGTNGLNECKAKDPVTGEPARDQWLEAPCLSWTKMKGKYNEAGANLQPFPFAHTSKRHSCE